MTFDEMYGEVNQIIRRKMYDYLKVNNMTKKDLGKIIGSQTLSKNDRRYSKADFDRLCNFFGCNITFNITFNDTHTPDDETQKWIEFRKKKLKREINRLNREFERRRDLDRRQLITIINMENELALLEGEKKC